MSSGGIARGTGTPRRPGFDLSLGALATPDGPADARTKTLRAAGPSDRRRGSFSSPPPDAAAMPPLAISIALVGADRAGISALPDARLDELTTFGARRAAEECRTHRIRVTFLVPGAHADRHAALLHQLAEEHEIGLYGFDPARPGPDDPLRARERLATATGLVARWYAPPFRAPASQVWIDAAGLRRAPDMAKVGIGPFHLPIDRALRWPAPIAIMLLRRACSRASARGAASANPPADGLAAVHLPLLAGSFARSAAPDLPGTLRPAAAPDLGMLARAARPGHADADASSGF